MNKEEILGKFMNLELDDLVQLVARHPDAGQKSAATVLLEFCDHTRGLIKDHLCDSAEQIDGATGAAEEAEETENEEDELVTWFHLVREGLSGRTVECDLVNRMAKSLEDYAVPHQFIFDFIRGISQERSIKKFRDRAELRTWACLVSSSMWLSVLKIFGVDVDDDHHMQPIVDLGVALALLDKLTNTKSQLALKRFFLADDELIDRSLNLYHQVEPFDEETWKDLVQFQCLCIQKFLDSSTRLSTILQGTVKNRIIFLVTERWGVLKKIRRQPGLILREKVSIKGFERFKLKLRSMFGTRMPKIGDNA